MSYPTKPAFAHNGSWDDESRSHPAMKWMENYTMNVIDKRLWETDQSPTEHHLPDFTLQTSDGTVVKGAENAWKALGQIYGPFAAHKHDPESLVCWETDDGWAMFGEASLYFRLQGLSGDAIADPQGEKWDGVAKGAFRFLYAKDGSDGIKLKETRIFSDASPAMRLMLKNNMINGEQLAGIVIGS